jgi:hydrogenase expression/formation protein HypE
MDGKITLEHGSGGALSRELVENVIYPRLKNSFYGELTDAATLLLGRRGKEAGPDLLFTTDTYTVQPYFFPGGDIGKLAVYGTCNDLAVSGGRPKYLSVGMVLEEGFPVADLERIADSIGAAAAETGTAVVTGDTKVVPRGRGGGIYINTSGIGERAAPVPLSAGRIIPGDKVICSGPVGSHGIALLAARERLSAGKAPVSDAAPLYPLCAELFGFGGELRFIRDATRGGAAAVCNEIVSGRNFGMRVEEERFPVLDNVRALAGILGLNPLEVANEGVFIAVVASASADGAAEKLRSLPGGSAAVCVGEVTEEHPGKVVLTTEIGGRRILGFPRGLLLPRIC